MNSRPLTARIRSLRLLLLDVDGVLTDGKIYIGPGGFELKSFHVHDGLGIKLLEEAGIRVGFLSNRKSPLVARRARELGVKIVQTGLADKVEAYEKLKRKLRLQDDEVGYVGDDIPDLDLLKKVGVPFAVRGAPPKLVRAALYTTRRRGGEGAVREIAELILREFSKSHPSERKKRRI
ncbi:MAG: HAD-IIIA family hydrolase [Proteobacteria bacterium]|nr:HAD-IIIA family hydrolase [Pseudomonadota bacterium]